MDILKDFIINLPFVARIVAYIIGIFVWTWFIFFYPNQKHESSTPASVKIDTGGGDYVGRDKYVYETKKEITPEEKLWQEKNSDPLVKSSIDKKEKELLIRVTAKKHVSTLALDVPILGKIISIHDYNSVTDAQTPLRQITGSQTDVSQNNVEFLIENIKPNTELSYKVIFTPMDKSIYIADTDRYKISYTWDFNGNVLSNEKWISFESGQVVDKPNVQVKEATIYNRALTPEEIKKSYEQGPSKRKVE